MNKEETKQLLQPLINSPPLTDQLLQRPPFRFLLDIVIEVSKETNFLKVSSMSLPFALITALSHLRYN